VGNAKADYVYIVNPNLQIETNICIALEGEIEVLEEIQEKARGYALKYSRLGMNQECEYAYDYYYDICTAKVNAQELNRLLCPVAGDGLEDSLEFCSFYSPPCH